MSEMGEMFKALRQIRQHDRKTAAISNYDMVMSLAKSLGVAVTTLPGGLRFHVPNTNESIDFWPSSAKWAHHTYPRGKRVKVMQGLESFSDRLRDRVAANKEG